MELKHALSIKPDFPHAENELACIYATADDLNLRNPSEALRLAKHAVQTSPQPVPAILDTLAEALLQNGQPAEALKTEQQAASLDPKNPVMQSRLAHFQAVYSSSSASKTIEAASLRFLHVAMQMLLSTHCNESDSN
jgi:tetratricopeptide (TPR) repeat protein